MENNKQNITTPQSEEESLEEEVLTEQEAKRGIPLFVDMAEPEIHDPAKQQVSMAWRGSNNISFKLLCCIEAIRDLTSIVENMSTLNNPLEDRRMAKHAATPLYSLAAGIRDMFNELQSNARDYSIASSNQRKELHKRSKNFSKKVPIDRDSDLRSVRDKIGAHIDKDAVITPEHYWCKINLIDYFKWMQFCIEEILHLLTLNIYGWTRESGHPDIWSLMSVDGTLVNFYMQDGQPEFIVNVTLVRSPKYGILSEIRRLVNAYNRVAAKFPRLQQIAMTEEIKQS